GPAQRGVGGGGPAPRPRALGEEVPRPAGAPDDRYGVDARGNHERELRARAEHAVGGRVGIDRDEPAALDVVRALASADRHLAAAPAAEVAHDLRAALPAHVHAEDVDARLRRTTELQAARDGRGTGGEEEQADEGQYAFHPGQ